MDMKIVVPCSFGTESVANYEIKKYVARNTRVQDGKVSFEGDGGTIAAANIFSRTGHRVYIVLCEFTAGDFDTLYDGVFRTDFAQYIPRDRAFPVSGYSIDSKLRNVPACQRVIKKAVAEKLKIQHKTYTLPETGQIYRLKFSLRKDRFSLMLDTTGEPLHKRGYRLKGGTAPIRETLAARIADLGRVGTESLVEDPFCGSGTLLIEAAMRARNIAPGLSRKFSGEKFGFLPEEIWKRQRARAESLVNTDVKFRAKGSDIDKNILKIAAENCKKAGVSSLIQLSRVDVKDFIPAKGSVILTNPPYGERMGDKDKARMLEKILGQRFLLSEDATCYVISSDEGFERNFGKMATRRRKLYNGTIPCQLYMYFR